MPSGRDILLVLDLDETLIHARGMALERPADLQVAGYHVYRRPGLAAFLERCFANFAVGIWSSASDGYVAEIVGQVVPDPGRLEFVWGASRVTQMRTLPHHHERYGRDLGEFHTQKRLKKLTRFGWPLERILIVDDSPEKSAQNYGNAVPVAPFLGDPADGELELLAAYLAQLREEPDFRRIEKRTWRASVDQGWG